MEGDSSMNARKFEFVEDRRIFNRNKYFIGDPGELMRIPPQVEKCAVFIGASKEEGNPDASGTGFLVNEESRVPGNTFMYLITAKHIIQGIVRKHAVQSIAVRFNFRDGTAQWVDIPLSEWRESRDSDVIVTRIRVELVAKYQHGSFPLIGAITKEYIDELYVGPGDEVFVVGLFSEHPGLKRIVPIARIGNISAMDVEGVRIRGRSESITGHLIEIRSIGGLSGSPVFVNALGPGQFLNEVSGRRKDTPYALLGLILGHWDVDYTTQDDAETKSVNLGMAVVTPVDRILETLKEFFEEENRKTEEEWFKQNGITLEAVAKATN